MVRLLPVVCLLAALLAPAAAPAAVPSGGGEYLVHGHDGEGDDWHVQARVADDARRLRHLVVYTQACGGHTPATENLPIGADGKVDALAPVSATNVRGAWWKVDARFTAPGALTGTFRVRTRTCDTGDRPFTARLQAAAGSRATAGPPMGTMPDLEATPARALREGRRLWLKTLRVARERFPTYAAARRQGYVRDGRRLPRPAIFHLRRRDLDRDARTLDAERPESLVYWWPRDRRPILIAFMFRAPAGEPPAFAQPMLAWHGHVENGRRGWSQMSHVWLTNGLKSGLANCLPARQLERAIPRFRFGGKVKGAAHESAPCPAG